MSHYALIERDIEKNNRKKELNVHLPVLDISVGLLSEEVIGICSVFLYQFLSKENEEYEMSFSKVGQRPD